MFTFKNELLKELQPQGGSVLMYIDTNGFCGAFTWLIIFIIVINQGDITPDQLYQYINYRVTQWREKYDTLLDQTKIKENLKNLSELNYVSDINIDLEFFERKRYNKNLFLNSESEYAENDKERSFIDENNINLKNLMEIIYPDKYLEKINLEEMKIEYESFIKQIINQLSQEDKIKLRNNSNIIQEFNWFEMSILSFLLYIKEFYEQNITEYPIPFFKDKKFSDKKWIEYNLN